MNKRLSSLLRSSIAGSVAIAALAFAPQGIAIAQPPITSTAALKQACETSAGNTVFINTSTEINQGVSLPHYEQVNTACRIVLGNAASLEFDSVAMRFAGNLTIESAVTNKLIFEKAELQAHNVALTLTGLGSEIMVNEAWLRALAGDVTLTMGESSKLVLKGATLLQFTRMLEATGAVRLSGGTKFTAEMNQGGIWAEGDIEINLNGSDSVLKAEEWNIWSNRGQTRLNGSGAKTLVEMGKGLVQGWTAIQFNLTGAESGLVIKERNFNTANNGPIDLIAGGNAPKGMIKFDQVRFGGDGSVTIRASAGSTEGLLEVTKGSIGLPSPNGLRNVVIETGASGSTIVKENSIHALILVRIASGPGGICLSEANTINAPAQQICP